MEKKSGILHANELDNEKLIFYMTGKKIVQTSFECSSEEEEGLPLLEVKNLSKKSNFMDISFKLYEGEILGITGLLGSGRTELATAIFGLNNPDSGEILH